jgi:hypothetical protein
MFRKLNELHSNAVFTLINVYYSFPRNHVHKYPIRVHVALTNYVVHIIFDYFAYDASNVDHLRITFRPFH